MSTKEVFSGALHIEPLETAKAFQAVAELRQIELRRTQFLLKLTLNLLQEFFDRQKNECDPSWTRFQCRVYDLLRFSGRVK